MLVEVQQKMLQSLKPRALVVSDKKIQFKVDRFQFPLQPGFCRELHSRKRIVEFDKNMFSGLKDAVLRKNVNDGQHTPDNPSYHTSSPLSTSLGVKALKKTASLLL